MPALPLYEGAKPCVRSGYCCKQSPCQFGQWNEEKHQCDHLVTQNNQYHCNIADEIMSRPGWEMNPAFGAGCCSPFNTDRQEILKNAR